MHHLGPLPLTFEGPEQGFGGKNCQNGSQGKPCSDSPALRSPVFVFSVSVGP